MLVLVSLLMVSCKKEPTLISNEEMISIQIEFNESLDPILDEMTDVYSGFIAYDISEREFTKAVESYEGRFEDMQNRYFEFNKEFKLETPSKEMTQIISKLENSRKYIQDIIKGSINKGRAIDREELLVLYVGGFAKVETELNEFTALVEKM